MLTRLQVDGRPFGLRPEPLHLESLTPKSWILTRLQVDALPLGLRLEPLHLRLQVRLGRQQLQLLCAHQGNLHSVRLMSPLDTPWRMRGQCRRSASQFVVAAACKNGSGAPRQ